jgi:predicted kinase
VNEADPEPLLVVVTGPPAGGKSTVADDLAAALGLPLLTKDGIKETLFDVLGTGDREWSRRLGEATWRVLFHVLEASLGAGCSLVAEGNFEADDANPRFAALPAFRGLQVYCDAPVEELLARFRERSEAGDRHPGHREGAPAEQELEQSLVEGRWRPLDLSGELIEVSSRDDPAEIVARVQAVLGR